MVASSCIALLAAIPVVVLATSEIQVLTKTDNVHLMRLAEQMQQNELECELLANTGGDRKVGVTLLTTELGVGLQQAAVSGSCPFALPGRFRRSCLLYKSSEPQQIRLCLYGNQSPRLLFVG